MLLQAILPIKGAVPGDQGMALTRSQSTVAKSHQRVLLPFGLVVSLLVTALALVSFIFFLLLLPLLPSLLLLFTTFDEAPPHCFRRLGERD